jgi:hypothetical protein
MMSSMMVYLLLGFMAFGIVLACLPSREEVASWRTPGHFGNGRLTKKSTKP